MKITIPQLSTNNVIALCEQLGMVPEDCEYVLDFASVSNFEPYGMLLSSSAIRQFCKKHHNTDSKVKVQLNKNKSFNYACHMGYFQSFNCRVGKMPGEAFGSSSYIPLTQIDTQQWMQEAIRQGRCPDQVDVIEEKAAELAKVLAQSNDELCKLFQYLIREAIRNVPEHAETDNVWICGQYWHNRPGQPAEIAILDEGIGIMKSLCKNRKHREMISSNVDALELAVKPGISRTFNPERGQKDDSPNANSGYGLAIISEICGMTGGVFTLLSGEDCLRIYPNSYSKMKTHFNGTALAIRIKTDGIHSYQEVINKARMRGETTAATIKNAFKEASVPSKGLLHDK